MKVLFLDIDGVLSHVCQRYAEDDGYLDKMDRYLLKNLAKVQQECGFKIVVSSTWRIGRTKEEMEEVFKDNGSVLDLHDDWATTTKEPYTYEEIQGSEGELKKKTDNYTTRYITKLYSATYLNKFCTIEQITELQNKTFDSELKDQRGLQIYKWLEEHPEVDCYLVVDDSSDMFMIPRDNFLHVKDGEMTNGLNMYQFNRIKNHFSKDK